MTLQVLKNESCLHVYWLPNTYTNEKEILATVMLTPALNIWLTCEWHKTLIKLEELTVFSQKSS